MADIAKVKELDRPALEAGDRVSFMIEPKPPKSRPISVRLSVSPVSSKKNSVKLDPGRNCPFSGRLKGVAPDALAAALASKEPKPFTDVS
jgi:hypothetical protein